MLITPKPHDDDEWDFPEVEQDKWLCQSCGHEFTRKWPKTYRATSCPKCKSEDAMPHGWSARRD
jgi:Zn finger protein HypA/HybF involved in hydrogenase expression